MSSQLCSIFVFIVLVEMRKRRKEVAASGGLAVSSSAAPAQAPGQQTVFTRQQLAQLEQQSATGSAHGAVAGKAASLPAGSISTLSQQRLAQLEQQNAAAHTGCPAPPNQSGKECAAGSGVPAAAEEVKPPGQLQPSSVRAERRVPLFRRERSSSQWHEGIEAGELFEVRHRCAW